MSGTKIVGIILLVGGILGLLIGHVDYTKDTEKGQIGPIKISVTETKSAIIPAWASIAAIVAGAALLVIRRG